MSDFNSGHLSLSNEHYTVPDVVEAYRALVGSIDLDPFSCEKANETVRAERYFSAEDGRNGFTEDWVGNIFCNPPGGFINPHTFISSKRGASSMAYAFDKAESEYLSGRAKQILFVAFSLELIPKRPRIFNYPLCFINTKGREQNPTLITGGGRLKYLDSNNQMQSSPTHGTFLVYMPLRYGESDDTDIPNYLRFLDIFEQFGSTGYLS